MSGDVTTERKFYTNSFYFSIVYCISVLRVLSTVSSYSQHFRIISWAVKESLRMYAILETVTFPKASKLEMRTQVSLSLYQSLFIRQHTGFTEALSDLVSLYFILISLSLHHSLLASLSPSCWFPFLF